MFKYIGENIDFSHKNDEVIDDSPAFKKHMHTLCELIFFVTGDVEYVVESRKKKLVKGDIVLIPSATYHFADAKNTERYERYVLKFSSDILPDFLNEKVKSSKYFYYSTLDLYTHFHNIENYYNNYKDQELDLLLKTELLSLLVKLTSENIEENAYRNDFMTKVLDYINTHIKDKISLEQIAEELQYSQTHVSTEFKKYMHISIMQYIKAKKVYAVLELIKKGYRKGAAAEMFGFENYSTFYRLYKNVEKFNPSEFKN